MQRRQNYTQGLERKLSLRKSFSHLSPAFNRTSGAIKFPPCVGFRKGSDPLRGFTIGIALPCICKRLTPWLETMTFLSYDNNFNRCAKAPLLLDQDYIA